MRRTFLAVGSLLLLLASRAEAQGSLSLQGLGYPTGQLSARAEATGGGVADFDALSVVSPAALGGVGGAALFFQYYRENANYLERTYDFVERVGIERVRRETIYAPLAVQQGLRERLRRSKAASRDAWLEGDAPRHPTQFVKIETMERLTG